MFLSSEHLLHASLKLTLKLIRVVLNHVFLRLLSCNKINQKALVHDTGNYTKAENEGFAVECTEQWTGICLITEDNFV